MITVDVFGDEARNRLIVRGPRGCKREVYAVVDTGFTASLSLPPKMITALGLHWQSFDRGILADGSETLFDVYEGLFRRICG